MIVGGVVEVGNATGVSDESALEMGCWAVVLNVQDGINVDLYGCRLMLCVLPDGICYVTPQLYFYYMY